MYFEYATYKGKYVYCQLTLLPWLLNATLLTLGKVPGCLATAIHWEWPHSHSRTLPSWQPVRSMIENNHCYTTSNTWYSCWCSQNLDTIICHCNQRWIQDFLQGGRCQPRLWGANPDVAMFHQICKSKRKNWEPCGGACWLRSPCIRQ